jgi:hypothetical protein
LDTELIQLGWKISAKYNATLKGWTVAFAHYELENYQKSVGLADAIRSLPTGSEKSERQRVKRNVIAYRRIKADLKQSESNPDGISDPGNYTEGTGTEDGSVLRRFTEGSEDYVYDRTRGTAEKDSEESKHHKLTQAKWWEELTDEQQAIVRDAQSTPNKKKKR